MTLTPADLAFPALAPYTDATKALVKALDAVSNLPYDPHQLRAHNRIVSAAMKADTALQEVTDAIHAARIAVAPTHTPETSE